MLSFIFLLIQTFFGYLYCNFFTISELLLMNKLTNCFFLPPMLTSSKNVKKNSFKNFLLIFYQKRNRKQFFQFFSYCLPLLIFITEFDGNTSHVKQNPMSNCSVPVTFRRQSPNRQKRCGCF